MKKFSLILFCFMLCSSALLAQRTVTGTVIDEEQIPLIGVTVQVEGTGTGTSTDIDGKYSITVPEGRNTLLFSYTGYSTQEVELGTSNIADLTMTFDVLKIDEVVVTASGIERQKKDLGYSITTIGGDDLTVARETNVVNALQGKTSGVQITSQSGNLGGSTKILIRGVSSLSGNNNPLWVVDGVPIFDSNISTGSRITGGFDVGNRAQDINPDDIETISVLKGAAAAALYGSRASNGAIIVTTKKGKKGDRAQIAFNSTLRFDNPLRLPEYQNDYAQGTGGKFEPESFQNGWGPKIDGRVVEDFRGEMTPLTAYPDNLENFYQTGQTAINNLSIAGATETSNIRLSLTSLNQTGLFPNSELDRYTIGLNSGAKFGQNISTNFGVNYVRTTSSGRVAQGANDPNVLTSLITTLPRNIDVTSLEPWIDESSGEAVQVSPIDGMTNNPYWIANENQFNTEVDRLYGNFAITYEPVFWLDITSRLGYDLIVDDRFRSNRKGTIGRINGDFSEDKIQQRQLDYNLLVSANKDLMQDLFLKVTAGFNYNARVLERNTLNAVDLTVDQLFDYGNAGTTSPIRDFSERRLFGFYGDITLSYKDFLALNITGRNDWSSTLPLANNSYFYPSTSLSFIFTDALKISNDVLSYGKLRASYASVGGDTGPYQLDFTFAPQTTAFGQFGTATNFPFNGNLAFAGPGTIPPDNLRPEISNSFEIGTELQFFQGRIGLDVTYYDVQTKDQILAIPIPQSSGFNFKRTNVGLTSNKGWEIELDADILRSKDFNWNVGVNFTKNEFVVEELAEGVDRLVINSGFNSIQVVAEPGQPYGLYGNTFNRDLSDTTMAYLDSPIIVDPNTGLRTAGQNERLGDVFPKFLMGFTNNFNWKGLSLRFTVDWRNGGLLYSETVQNLRSLGLAAETGVNREASYIDPDAFIVAADGTLRANDVPTTMQAFWGAYASGNIAEGNTYDASFVKLREIGLSYSLPKSVLGNSFIKGVSFGVEGRNLAILMSKIPHIDPETNLFGSANDGAGIEFNSPVTTRSIGGNIKVTF